MPLFAVIGLDHPPHDMARRQASQMDHRRYVLTHDEPIALTGAMLDEAGSQCGSFYLFEAESEQQVRDWFEQEPFFKAGIYKDFVVRRFLLGRTLLPIQDWGMSKTDLDQT
jgi:uncharacterized protein YciI